MSGYLELADNLRFKGNSHVINHQKKMRNQIQLHKQMLLKVLKNYNIRHLK